MSNKRKNNKKSNELSVSQIATPMPNNPRTITESSAEGLRYSLNRFGDIAGIVWNRRTGHLVCGHQRMEQLKTLYSEDNLKLKLVEQKGDDVFYALITPDNKTYTVRVVDWDEDTELQANIAANNPHIMGMFVNELLEEHLATIKRNNEEIYSALRFDLIDPVSSWGVDEDELNKIEQLQNEDEAIASSKSIIVENIQDDQIDSLITAIKDLLDELNIDATVRVKE